MNSSPPGPPPTSHTTSHPGMDWSRWSVILLKPDCLHRGLTGPVLHWIAAVVDLRAAQRVTASQEQVFAHYADLFDREAEIGVDVAAELRRLYLSRQVVVALGHGTSAAARLRELIGPTDPAAAGPGTIRGQYGIDTLARGRAEGRLIDNLVHTSDDPAAARRDFTVWFGDRTDLLSAPCQRTEKRP